MDVHKDYYAELELDSSATAQEIRDAYRTLVKNGPQGGSLKDVRETKTVIAGTQMATVDAYGATLFGIKPEGLPHIVKSSKFGLGEIDLEKVNIEKVSLG